MWRSTALSIHLAPVRFPEYLAWGLRQEAKAEACTVRLGWLAAEAGLLCEVAAAAAADAEREAAERNCWRGAAAARAAQAEEEVSSARRAGAAMRDAVDSELAGLAAEVCAGVGVHFWSRSTSRHRTLPTLHVFSPSMLPPFLPPF